MLISCLVTLNPFQDDNLMQKLFEFEYLVTFYNVKLDLHFVSSKKKIQYILWIT